MIHTIDVSILNWIQDVLRTDWLDQVFPIITRFGDGGLFWIAIAVFLLAIPKARKAGLQMLLALALGYVIGNLCIKNIIARPRPFVSNPLIELLINTPKEYSFPSGHTLSSFSAAITIFMYHKRFGIAALLFASLIAFSRMYLYVHYPTDIFGAIVLAVIIAFMAKYIVAYLSKKNVL